MNQTGNGEAQANTAAQQPTATPEHDASHGEAVSGIGAEFRKGMAYGAFRELVLGRGWQPVVNPECKANLLGADADTQFCSANPNLVNCRICDELPELQSCSSDARCLVLFRHDDGTQLEARAYGEVEYWRETGDDPGLQVTDWQFAASPGK